MISGTFYQNMIQAKCDLTDVQKCEIAYLES
jgi:hypothetical protein